MKQTYFDNIGSYTDLHLIEQTVDVQPAQPKLNYIDVPGADGSKDLTGALDGVVRFENRTIEWTYALYPGDDWYTKQKQVSNALNGKKCNITLHGDPDYYYVGRLAVSSYAKDKVLRQITITATCEPYKYAKDEVVESDTVTTTFTTYELTSGRMPVHPVITASAEIVVEFDSDSYSLSFGTHKVIDITLAEGVNEIKIKAAQGVADITISYRAGDL